MKFERASGTRSCLKMDQMEKVAVASRNSNLVTQPGSNWVRPWKMNEMMHQNCPDMGCGTDRYADSPVVLGTGPKIASAEDILEQSLDPWIV